jgi:hypothetical protein
VLRANHPQFWNLALFTWNFVCPTTDHHPPPFSYSSLTMPEISRFLGIVISMYFNEHNPPHFHVRYNEFRATVEIESLNVLRGNLPARVRGLVEEWAEMHKEELMEMWETKKFHAIDPLV